MVAPPIFWCEEPHTALPFVVLVGAKPPSNQPQVIFLAFSRSPMFGPLIAAVAPTEQSSNVGSRSPMTVPFSTLLLVPVTTAPCVWPEIRLSAPGVDGPNSVSKKLSLIQKYWA